MSENPETDITRCPGCGLNLPDTEAPVTDRYNASSECWQLYGELSAYTVSRNGPAFIHQHSVDAYGAQHSGGKTKPITTAFALIGLFLAVERNYTGRRVQHAHTILGEQARDWPQLTPPSSVGDLTVQATLNAETGDERDRTIENWAESVWQAWEHSHEWVREVCDESLEIDR